MASYCVCGLRRFLHPSSTCFLSPPSIVTRWGHMASSQDSVSNDMAAKESSSSGTVGPVDKKAEKSKNSRPINAWVPDPDTGYYRPINEATEAQEIAMKRNK